MTAPMQAGTDERIQFQVEVQGASAPIIRDFTFVEGISRPYSLEIDIAVPSDTDAEGLLGQDLALTMTRPDFEERAVGVVTEARTLGVDRAAEELPLNLRLVVQPAFALLAFRRNSRIFQDKAVDAIVQEVLDEALGPYNRTAELSLDGSYEAREYCVQYEESDLDFIHRLLEEEGIHYVFDHSGEREVLKLGDRNGAFPDQGAIPFVSVAGVSQLVEAVRRFEPAHRASTTHVSLRDWNFQSAGAPVGDEDGADDEDFKGERRLYDHGIERKPTASLLKTRAKVRAEAFRIHAASRLGVSQSIQLRAGRVFELTGSPMLGADGAYLVTEATHSLRTIAQEEAFSGVETYANRFRCVPSDLPFRAPRVTARPRIEGVESATVTGPSGEEIGPDEHGRVKVLFAWDRLGANDETSSCWVRVEQPWAGDGFGWMFIPRIGMEVLVQFVDGNPDRPLITGCLYNGQNVPPYPLPDEKNKSTIKTNSSLGGGGFNELCFDDTAGSEMISLHAQKDFDEVILNNHTTDVVNDQTHTVDGNQTQDIGADQTRKTDKNQKTTNQKERKIHVKSDSEETYDGGELRIVLGGSEETYNATESRTVVGGVNEIVIGGDNLTAGADKAETINGGQTQIVVGGLTEDVSGGPSSTSASGMINVLSPSGLWAASSALTIKGGAMYNVIAPPGITINATNYNETTPLAMKLGATNLAVTGMALTTWAGFTITVAGGTFAGAGVSASVVAGLALGMTGIAAEGGGVSASATGFKLHMGPVQMYEAGFETVI